MSKTLPLNNQKPNIYNINNKLREGFSIYKSSNLVQPIEEDLSNELLIKYSNFMKQILDDQNKEKEMPKGVAYEKHISYKIKETPDIDNESNIVKILSDIKYNNFISMINRNNLYKEYLNNINGIPIVLVVGHNNKTKQFVQEINSPNANQNKALELMDYYILFTRHAYSCNNLKDKTINSKIGSIAYGKKDWEPSLTIIGIICSINRSEQLKEQFQFNQFDILKVCVSCLIRTWETAILLYLQYCDVLELNILPYLKEEEGIGLKRGNYPIHLKWQIYEVDIFIKTLKKLINGNILKNIFLNNKTIIFNISNVKIELQISSNMNIQNKWNYIDNNGNKSEVGVITEEITQKYNKLKNNKTELNIVQLNGGLMEEPNKNNNTTLLQKIYKQNLWSLLLSVKDDYINKIKISYGVSFTEQNLKYTVSACETNCFYNTIRDSKRNIKCLNNLKEYMEKYEKDKKYGENTPSKSIYNKYIPSFFKKTKLLT